MKEQRFNTASSLRSAQRRAIPIASALLLGATFATACSDHAETATRLSAPTGTPAAVVRAVASTNTSVHWNEVARSLVASHNTNTPMASRVYALVSVAQYVAARAADDLARSSANGRDMKLAAVRQAAIVRASAAVLTGLYPDSASAITIAAQSVGTQAIGATSSVSDQSARNNTISGDAIGAAVGRGVLFLASSDGAGAANCPSTPPLPASRFWHDDAVPPDPQPLLPCFGKVRTWTLVDVKRFRADPPPAFGSPEFLAGVATVREISDTRSAAVLATVDKWLDGNNTFTPAGRWNVIASDLIARHGLDDEDAARVLALVNVAMMDTHVACWDRKYTYWELRPWQADSLITTPRGRPHHPSNPSGHGCAGGAGSATLAGLFPTERDSLVAMGEEQAFTTVQSGVHYPFDVADGLHIGRTIAARALALGDLGDIVKRVPRR